MIWDVPRLVCRYYSYLLPMQAGGTPQILVDKTSRMTGRLRARLFPIQKNCVGDFDTETVSRLFDTFKVSLV